MISGVFVNCKSRGWFLGDLELNRRSRGNTGSHVATSQRHDVTTISTSISLKAMGDLISGVSKSMRIGGRKIEQQ